MTVNWPAFDIKMHGVLTIPMNRDMAEPPVSKFASSATPGRDAKINGRQHYIVEVSADA